MTKYKCACGYIHDGDTPPDVCPKCGGGAAGFTKLEDAAAKLVERSRHSNSLHCRLYELAREMEAVCKDGVDDALDPGCVDVFTKSLTHSWEIMKLAMTEMAIHVGKSKWG